MQRGDDAVMGRRQTITQGIASAAQEKKKTLGNPDGLADHMTREEKDWEGWHERTLMLRDEVWRKWKRTAAVSVANRCAAVMASHLKVAPRLQRIF
jgi:hypothetical protein